jgi:hypothetical protein
MDSSSIDLDANESSDVSDTWLTECEIVPLQ